MNEIVKDISALTGCVLSVITLVTLIFKPVRMKFINWLRGTAETDKTMEALTRIEDKVDKQGKKTQLIAEASLANARNDILQLVDKCLERGFITSIDESNLKDMYEAYHNLGGDSYATARKNLALELPKRD